MITSTTSEAGKASPGPSQRLGRPSLAGVTVFSLIEPCAMCAGALLEADVDRVVFALADPRAGACGSVRQLLGQGVAGSRVRVVSGILADEAAELRPDLVVRTASARTEAPGSVA